MALVSPFWFDMAELWVGTFFYGIYLVLFSVCVHILLHRPRSRANTVLLVTAIMLFILCTVQTVLNLILGTADILELDDFPYDPVIGAANFLYDVNNFVADGLVIYRCYVIWNRNFLIVIPGIAGLIITMALALLAFIDENVSLTPFFVLSLATNLTVSFLTAVRIWWVGRQSRLLQGKAETNAQYVTTMAIIIESGIIYSLFVLAWLIVRAFPDTYVSSDMVFAMLTQVVGIVPTLIIVRVGLGAGAEHATSAAYSAGANSSGMKFASRPVLDSEASFASRSVPRGEGGSRAPMEISRPMPMGQDVEKGFGGAGSIAGSGSGRAPAGW